MSFVALQAFLLWCTVLNYVLLLVWWALLKLPHQWLYKLSTQGMKVTEEEFDRLNLKGIVFYKMAIILFCLVPLLATHLIRS